MARQKIKRTAKSATSAHSARPSQSSSPRSSTTVTAIVILLLYQGYTLSIVGIASPWIAKSFALDEGKLARLFAWMAISAFGSLLLARLADRVGRRLVILSALMLAPLFSAGAALSPTAQRVRRMRDNGFRTARRISLVGDRVARRRTSGQTARSRTSGRGLGERYRRCTRLSDHPRAFGVELFVALAPGAVGSWDNAGSAGGDDAAGAIEMVERKIERNREAQSLLRYFSSDLSTPLDHVADLRRARHDRRHGGKRLALLSSGFDPRPLAGSRKHAGSHRNGSRHDRISAGRVDVGTIRSSADRSLYGRRGMARRVRVLSRTARIRAVAVHVAGRRCIAGSKSRPT